MKRVVLSCLLLGGSAWVLHAGSVITLRDGAQVTGKLSLTATAIHVDKNPGSADINLEGILEATFGDAPFHLETFSSSPATTLPPAWKGQDIGTVTTPGSVADAGGTVTLSFAGDPAAQRKRQAAISLFFVGQPWTGDGEWKVRVKEIAAKTYDTKAGLMVRDGLDPEATLFSISAMTGGNGALLFRGEAGRAALSVPAPMDLPIWLRLTRYGTSIIVATSTDGAAWDVIGARDFTSMTAPWVGIFADGLRNGAVSNAVFDQISLTPNPSTAQVLPSGILLQSGSFLAGTIHHLGFDAATPDAAGNFLRNGTPVNIPRSKIAAVTMLPTLRSQITDMASHVGLLMKNGDTMDGDFEAINQDEVRIGSVLLGPSVYNRSDIRVCLLHPMQPQPAAYEIRLTDGSLINASAIAAAGDGAIITEVSGLPLTVAANEIAQVRAGTAQVQFLAGTNWKATAAPAATTPPATNAPPAADALPSPVPLVQTWEGPNQEQILQASPGTTIEFPLKGKFSAIGVKVALTSDSPPNSLLVVRVLSDGKEVAHTPPFKAGDQPSFMEVTLQNPKTVALVTESTFPGAKALFIDPIAIGTPQP